MATVVGLNGVKNKNHNKTQHTTAHTTLIMTSLLSTVKWTSDRQSSSRKKKTQTITNIRSVKQTSNGQMVS